MSSLIRHLTFDAADPFVLAGFWAQALDGSLADDDFPGDPEAVVTTAAATLLFVRVDDRKAVKNRVHLDLNPRTAPGTRRSSACSRSVPRFRGTIEGPTEPGG